MRIKITFSFDGSKFHGFQRQNNVRNVQGFMEESLFKIYNEDIVIKGTGRTDASVHGVNYVAHYDVTKKVKNLKKKINLLVKPDVFVKNIKVVDESFHARFSVKSKVYIYKINVGKHETIKDNYYFQPRYKVDIKKLRDAAKVFVGTHDFRNFISGSRENYITHINKINVYKFNNTIFIKFNGVGFYRYMVRNLVGAMLEVNKNKVTLIELKDMLDNYLTKVELPTAPPFGLYLYKVHF